MERVIRRSFHFIYLFISQLYSGREGKASHISFLSIFHQDHFFQFGVQGKHIPRIGHACEPRNAGAASFLFLVLCSIETGCSFVGVVPGYISNEPFFLTKKKWPPKCFPPPHPFLPFPNSNQPPFIYSLSLSSLHTHATHPHISVQTKHPCAAFCAVAMRTSGG